MGHVPMFHATSSRERVSTQHRFGADPVEEEAAQFLRRQDGLDLA
jgi:hypothetical protein